MDNPLLIPSFTGLVLQYFGFLREQHNFWGLDENYSLNAMGSGTVRLESDRYVLVFHWNGKDLEVTIEAGLIGQPLTDLSWIFAHLTRGLVSGPTGGAPSLYYFPYFSLGLRSEENVRWQLARLSEILQPLWPAIFIFLDRDGARGGDFLAYIERAKRANAELGADGYRRPAAQLAARESLGFVASAQSAFMFLNAYGFRCVYADPIFVRFEKLSSAAELASEEKPSKLVPAPAAFRPGSYLNVFHRLHSFQVDLHTGQKRNDPVYELDFNLHELAAWRNAEYQPVVARSSPELRTALNRLSRLFRKYAAPILAGDSRLFEALHTRRIDAAHKASRAWTDRNRQRG